MKQRVHLQYFMNEAKGKSKNPNQKVEIQTMKPGRKYEDNSSSDSANSGCGCFTWIIIGLFIACLDRERAASKSPFLLK